MLTRTNSLTNRKQVMTIENAQYELLETKDGFLFRMVINIGSHFNQFAFHLTCGVIKYKEVLVVGYRNSIMYAI